MFTSVYCAAETRKKQMQNHVSEDPLEIEFKMLSLKWNQSLPICMRFNQAHDVS